MNRRCLNNHWMLFCLALCSWNLSACNGKMSSQQCLKLRGQAFDIIGKGHPCNDDSECLGTAWPGCTKPVNDYSFGKIKELKETFDKGGCTEPPPSRECRKPPEVYCKQGLCVFREKAKSL